MNRDEEEFKEKIYNLMIGTYNLERFPIEESQYVTNEYKKGEFCDIAYKEVFTAKRRICERLGVDEDEDVELIINNLLDIGRYLSIKMYDYGIFFSSPSIK